jgi:DNA modification methylase
MPRVEIIEDDCRRAMRRMIGEGRQFQSIVTDPPYHLLSIVKRFGKQGSAPAKFGKDGAFARISKGFNGQTWDGEDGQGRQIAHDPALWRLCHDLLLPGGFMLTFSCTARASLSPMPSRRAAKPGPDGTMASKP